jgi:UDP-N-acetyl-D-mannosaminuronate dehydrogenase
MCGLLIRFESPGHPRSESSASNLATTRVPPVGIRSQHSRSSRRMDGVKITVIGTGWVGLVFGACLADTGKGFQLCPDLDHVVEYGKIQVICMCTPPDVQYLLVGAGYEGSCFPKGVNVLIRTAGEHGRVLGELSAVEQANDAQKWMLSKKVVSLFGEDLAGRRIALWDLAYKRNTDDIREAPSRVVVAGLRARGATVCAYDPAAMHEARRAFGMPPGLAQADDPIGALEGADTLLIVIEWKEFRSPDFDTIRAVLLHLVVIGKRNLYLEEMLIGSNLEYLPICRHIHRAGARMVAPTDPFDGRSDARPVVANPGERELALTE